MQGTMGTSCRQVIKLVNKIVEHRKCFNCMSSSITMKAIFPLKGCVLHI